jgi:hypothetical protein
VTKARDAPISPTHAYDVIPLRRLLSRVAPLGAQRPFQCFVECFPRHRIKPAHRERGRVAPPAATKEITLRGSVSQRHICCPEKFGHYFGEQGSRRSSGTRAFLDR